MTRTSKKLKTVISLLAVVIVLSSIAIVPVNAAYTPYWQRNRAFIAAAISAINISLSSAKMTAADIVDYVIDPLEVTYTYSDTWADRPQIQIWDDYVEIDGQYYTDIWISNEAAEKFRVNAFDFKTAYQIASNDSGTFKQGLGYYDGVPVFGNTTNWESQNWILPESGDAPVGYATFSIVPYSSTASKIGYKNSLGTTTTSGSARANTYMPFQVQYQKSGNTWRVRYEDKTDYMFANSAINTSLYDYDPFDYNYVSTDIPANQPLPSDTGMMIRIPSEDPQGNKWLGDFLTDYPEFNQGEPVTIDVNLDPDIMNKLDDLIDIIAPIIPIINNNDGDVTFIENHENPDPGPDYPIPADDDVLPDVPWGALQDKLEEIRRTIQNLTPDFSQIIQAIQNIPQSFSQITSPIIQAISNLGDQILRDIEEGPIRLLDKLIDVLRSLFFPILATLRNFLGIWHYVVTWMSNISAPFTWIMGLMAGASPILVSPIYALIAGIIVIAVYRRFGR